MTRGGWLVAALLALAVCAALAARAPLGADYAVAGVDAAQPQIDALAAGDLHAFAAHQAAQGPVSLALRAPLAALAPAHDLRARYRLGSFICLVALALAGLLVGAVMDRRGAPPWQIGLVLALFLLAPVVSDAIKWGHPEDLLATAWLVAAAVGAACGYPIAGGVACGLAVGTKAWALMGVAPVVLAAGNSWRRALTATAGVIAVVTLPLVIAEPHAFREAVHSANASPLVHPADIWWQFSQRAVPMVPGSVRESVRPLSVVLVAVIALLAARRSRLTLGRTFLVLALAFLLRCILDPGDNRYYHVPFLICLVAWEAVSYRRPPVIGLIAAAVTATVPSPVAPHRNLASAAYLLWSIPAAVWLALELFEARNASEAFRSVRARRLRGSS